MAVRHIIVLVVIIVLLSFAYFQFNEMQKFFVPDSKEKIPHKLKIITEIDPPFSYLDQGGEIKGSSVELVKKLATIIGKPYSIELLRWSSGYGRTLSTPYTALFPTARTEERESLFKWVGPVDQMDYAFYCRSSDKMVINSTKDLKGAGLIAVPLSTARHQMLLDEKITNIIILSNDVECIHALLSGDADLWLGSVNMYSQDRGVLGEGLESLRKVYPWKRVPLYIAFNIDTPDELVNAWQKTFNNLDPALKEQIMQNNIPYYCSWIDCTYCNENPSKKNET